MRQCEVQRGDASLSGSRRTDRHNTDSTREVVDTEGLVQSQMACCPNTAVHEDGGIDPNSKCAAGQSAGVTPSHATCEHGPQNAARLCEDVPDREKRPPQDLNHPSQDQHPE